LRGVLGGDAQAVVFGREARSGQEGGGAGEADEGQTDDVFLYETVPTEGVEGPVDLSRRTLEPMGEGFEARAATLTDRNKEGAKEVFGAEG
jgi:hypothetical protein